MKKLNTEIKNKFSNNQFVIVYIGLVLDIILLVIFQQLLYSKAFYALSADESGHTLEAYHFFNNSSPIFSIWLPFQKILYSLLFFIHQDLFWLPRITSNVFGVLTVFALVYMSYQLFENQLSLVLTGFLASIFWAVVVFSVLPLTEIYFLFSAILSIAFFINWYRNKNNILLFLSILFTIISTTIRFEAWVIAFVLLLEVIIKISNANSYHFIKVTKVLIVSVSMFIFPIIWIILSYVNTESFWGFINLVSDRHYSTSNFSEFQINPIYSFFLININSINIIGLISLISLRNSNPAIKPYLRILFLSLLIIGMTTFLTGAIATHNHFRLVVFWSTLLLPFTAHWISRFLNKTDQISLVSFIVFIFMIIYFFSNQTVDYSKTSYISREDVEIGTFLRDKIFKNSKDSRIFINKNKWKYTNILVLSEKPEKFINDDEVIFTQDAAENKKILKENNVEYLVIDRTTEQQQNILGATTLIRANKKWAIYKLY